MSLLDLLSILNSGINQARTKLILFFQQPEYADKGPPEFYAYTQNEIIFLTTLHQVISIL